MRCLFLFLSVGAAGRTVVLVLGWIGFATLAIVAAAGMVAAIVLTIGLRAQIYFDSAKQTICADFYAAGIHLIKWRAFVNDRTWYARVNRKEAQPIRFKPKKKLTPASKREMARIALQAPRLRLRRFHLGITQGTDDWAHSAYAQGIFNLLSLASIASGRIAASDLKTAYLPRAEVDGITANADIIVSWGILPIILWILRIIRAKREVKHDDAR